MSSQRQSPGNGWTGRLCDCLKLAPSLGWLVMSVFAFPAYLAMGWYTPTILSVLSSALALGFAYEILTYHRRYKYVVAGEYLLGWEKKKTEYPTVKIALISSLLALLVLFTVLLLYTFYAYIQPCDARYNKDGSNTTTSCPVKLRAAPCNGRCEGCETDPDCKEWTSYMMEHEWLTNMCPPPKDSYVGDATFSCAADGYWMLCTCLIGALWLVSVVITAQRVANATPMGMDRISVLAV